MPIPAAGSGLYDHIVIFDPHRECLGLIGALLQRRSGLHMRLELAELDPLRVKPGFPGANIEFPIVPRATDHLTSTGIDVFARRRAFHMAGKQPLAEAAPLVRAAIGKGKKFAAQIEDDDPPLADSDDMAATWRDVRYRSNNMPRHG